MNRVEERSNEETTLTQPTCSEITLNEATENYILMVYEVQCHQNILSYCNHKINNIMCSPSTSRFHVAKTVKIVYLSTF